MSHAESFQSRVKEFSGIFAEAVGFEQAGLAEEPTGEYRGNPENPITADQDDVVLFSSPDQFEKASDTQPPFEEMRGAGRTDSPDDGTVYSADRRMSFVCSSSQKRDLEAVCSEAATKNARLGLAATREGVKSLGKQTNA
jgi:hypothetical protein